MYCSVYVNILLMLILFGAGKDLLWAQCNPLIEKTLVVDTFSACLSLQEGFRAVGTLPRRMYICFHWKRRRKPIY